MPTPFRHQTQIRRPSVLGQARFSSHSRCPWSCRRHRTGLSVPQFSGTVAGDRIAAIGPKLTGAREIDRRLRQDRRARGATNGLTVQAVVYAVGKQFADPKEGQLPYCVENFHQG